MKLPKTQQSRLRISIVKARIWTAIDTEQQTQDPATDLEVLQALSAISSRILEDCKCGADAENDSAERLKRDIINGCESWHSIKARFLALGGGAAAFELTKSPAIGKKLRKKLSKLVR